MTAKIGSERPGGTGSARRWLAVGAWAVAGFATLLGSAYLGAQWPGELDALDYLKAAAGGVAIGLVALLARTDTAVLRRGGGHRRADHVIGDRGARAGPLPQSLQLQRKATLHLSSGAVVACAATATAVLAGGWAGAGSAAALAGAAAMLAALGLRQTREAGSAARVEAAARTRARIGSAGASDGELTLTLRYRPLPTVDRRTLERLVGNAIADTFSDLEIGAQYGLNESTLYAIDFWEPAPADAPDPQSGDRPAAR